MVRSTPDAQGRPIRLQRIGEQVRHALAEIIARGDLRDEIISRTIISVSEVRVTPDLRQATVFVKASNGDDDAVVKALGQHRGWLRGEVAKRLATKYTPDLSFRRDDSYDAGARIDEVLRRPEIARDLPPAEKPGARPWKSLADSMDEDVGDD
ncbi:30S ribosome-binding factor RbfA [Sandarakinorhabdus sp.]|jgi:ribosome-binding factor A|uniref:30S ribosome-binding factor RbfA n=1 Tax=Sandarakinorhabdus sp. TaxID=1916663 RepID=UPI0028B02BDA|nr:30S ribosome-binding factor RbfA [Sandarakinorhabdus sp.]